MATAAQPEQQQVVDAESSRASQSHLHISLRPGRPADRGQLTWPNFSAAQEGSVAPNQSSRDCSVLSASV